MNLYWEPILNVYWIYRFANIVIQELYRNYIGTWLILANIGTQDWTNIRVLDANIGPILDQYIVFMGFIYIAQHFT